MLPVTPVVVPLFTAALLAALTKVIPQRLSQLLALASVLTTLAITLVLLHDSSGHLIIYWMGNWRPTQGVALGISFAIDPLGAGLAALASFLTLVSLVFSSRYFDTVGGHFHALMLTFLAAMCGFALTGDMFNLFVFFELMSASAFALCGYKTDDPGSVQGALNFAVTNTIAAYFVLTGIALIYARTGALNMAQMGRALGQGPLDNLVLVGFVFLVCGYLVKAAVVPFHFWLPDAHAVAPTPACVLFSGVMVEMGLYALARIYWATFNPRLHAHLAGLTTLFVTTGVVTAFVGAFMCYLQRNLKRLLAFSTISHVGVMLIGISLFSPGGLAGAAVYTLGHGMVKSALFLTAGILLHRFQAIDERDLHGKAVSARWTGAVFFLGGLGLAGFPLSGLAAGDDLMSLSADAAGFTWVKWIFVFASAVTAAAVFRAGARIFFGCGPAEQRGTAPKHEEKPETHERHQHIAVTMFVPAAVLAIAGLFLGLTPRLKTVAMEAATHFENSGAYAAHVLNAQTVQQSVAVNPIGSDAWAGLVSIAAALLIAAVHLFSERGRKLWSQLAIPLRLLHRIHSGHVGDYVAFLTFGMACFGLLCAYCFR